MIISPDDPQDRINNIKNGLKVDGVPHSNPKISHHILVISVTDEPSTELTTLTIHTLLAGSVKMTSGGRQHTNLSGIENDITPVTPKLRILDVNTSQDQDSKFGTSYDDIMIFVFFIIDFCVIPWIVMFIAMTLMYYFKVKRRNKAKSCNNIANDDESGEDRTKSGLHDNHKDMNSGCSKTI